jgi:hypothetical protein
MDRPRSRPQRFSECAGGLSGKEHHHAPHDHSSRSVPDAGRGPFGRNGAILRHFERDAIPCALETDWPVEAGGFEPLHFGIRSAAVDHGLRLSSGMRSGTTNFN